MRVSIGNKEIAASVEQPEEDLKVKLGIEDSIMYNMLHKKYMNTPRKLVKQEFILVLKMKLMDLFTSNEAIPSSLDKDIILEDMESNLIPLIDKYIDYIIFLDGINNRAFNIFISEISNIVFGYMKLEFMRHSLIFKDSFNKNYVDEIFEYMSKRIKGEDLET